MKKTLNLIVTLLLAGTVSTAWADNVTVQQACKAGAKYMDQKSMTHKSVNSDELSLAYRYDNPKSGAATIYIFNVAGGGWIAVSGSTLVDPIVAYADEGRFVYTEAPTNMLWMLDEYSQFVGNRQDRWEGVEKNQGLMCGEWQQLLDGSFFVPAPVKVNHTLLTCSWDQLPYYNMYAPYDGNTQCPAGCVAVAMGQIMYYFRYPVQPKGSPTTTFQGTTLRVKLADTTFNYSNMRNALATYSGAALGTPAQRREVAKLLYCAAISVGMNFAADGSGAQSTNVPRAMRNNFKYKLGNLIYRGSTNSANFCNGIRANLLDSVPCYMGGASSTGAGGRDAAGHAWVCDGYQDDNSTIFHMNWGWGGSNNAWFNLYMNEMSTAVDGNYNSVYTFDLMQEYITGMTPPDDTLAAKGFPLDVNTVESACSALSVYPNPAVSAVTVDYSMATAADFRLITLDGKLAMTRRIEAGQGSVRIDVSQLPAGIYLYSLGSETGKLIVK